MTDLITLRRDAVETLSDSCPARYAGEDAFTGRDVEIRYANWTLRVTVGSREVFSGDVPDASSSQGCSLEAACAAAGIVLLGEGDEMPVTLRRSDVVTECHACPTTFVGRDAITDQEVQMRYRHGTLHVRRDYAEVFCGDVPDAPSDGVCSLDEACRAADIRLI